MALISGFIRRLFSRPRARMRIADSMAIFQQRAILQCDRPFSLSDHLFVCDRQFHLLLLPFL